MRIKDINKQISDETSYLKKLKLKMETIKHSAADFTNDEKTEISHDHAIRQGDYSLFEEESDKKQEYQESLAHSVLVETSSVGSEKASFESTAKSLETAKLSKMETFKSFALNFYRKVLAKVILRMHRSSRNYSYIYKLLVHEKRALKNAMTPVLNASTDLM